MGGSSGDGAIPALRIGLVGCGRMGTAVGRHLLKAGWTLTVTDVDPDARARLVAEGAAEAETPGLVAAAADLIFVIVVDDDQVREVVAAQDGLLATAGEGAIVAISSSVRPDTCRDLEGAAAKRGVQVIDVALVRGERGAEAGHLLLLCGGPEEAIETCRPAFAAFASDVRRLGDVGAGQVGKVVNNILLWSCLRADVEALRLGRALGVEPSVLREALADGSGANRPLAEWGHHRLRWPGKDLEAALKLAGEAGLDVPLVRALAPLMEDLTVADLEALA